MNYAIETTNVCKFLGNKLILSDITLHVRQGSIYGFLGKNGAGKTSFFKILMGLWNMDLGSVNVAFIGSSSFILSATHNPACNP